MRSYTQDQKLSVLLAVTKWERGAFDSECPVCSNQRAMNDGNHGRPKAHTCKDCPVSDYSGTYGCHDTPFLAEIPISERGVAYLKLILANMKG